ncbi:MAG TPA: hypothetical protein VFB50_14550, partial [Chloroflexota bacterium]|nr:hypothetical protein [Chloroflexota bacterium]
MVFVKDVPGRLPCLAARPVVLTAIGALLVYAILRPIVGLGHELTVAALAWALHAAVGTGAWEPIIGSLGLDPIYTGAAIRAAGGVQVIGFAAGGQLGAALHTLLPGVFLAAEQVAASAGISMVAAPGAPALGRGLASFGADLIWLTAGLAIFWRWRRTNWPVALLGLMIQAQIAVNHLLAARVSLADVDASGVPFALQLAVPNGGWFTSGLGALPSQARDLLIGGSLVFLAYAIACLLLLVAWATMRLCRFRSRRKAAAVIRTGAGWRWLTQLAGVGLALATA